MASPYARKPAFAAANNRLQHVDQLGGSINHANSVTASNAQEALVAVLSGDDTCACARITARGNAPVLALCRALIGAGHDPATPLHAYRGETLALIVRSIGEAACLRIGSDGVGFRRKREPDTASPVRQTEEAATPIAARVTP